jgi:tRNA(fMet)-specific endonuclease VapC
VNFLLDSDTCSAYLRDDRRVFNRFLQHGGAFAISTVVAGELLVSAAQRGADSVFAQRLEGLLVDLTVLPYDLAWARRFGEIRAHLLARGLASAPMDLLVAATALVHDLTLVTRNTRHFEHVPELRLQNWLA